MSPAHPVNPSSTPSNRAYASPTVRRAVTTGIVVALLCGLGGGLVGEDVIGALGRFTDHSEPTLRILGWCWGGLPFALVVVAVYLRGRISPRAKPAIAVALAVWAGSGAFLLPNRRSTTELRFGDAYPDAQVLSFAWAAGFLSNVALLIANLLVVLVGRKLLGRGQTRGLDLVFAVLAALVIGAGLVMALAGPVP